MNKCKLKDVAVSQTGPFGSQLHEKDYVSVGTPIVTVEHLGDTGFTNQNLPMVSDYDAKRLSKYTLEEGDIVFSRVGSIDRNVYTKKEQKGWLFSGRCIRVRCNKAKVNSRYLSFYFRLPWFKNMMLNRSVGATMPSLNTKIMDELPLSLLDRKEQDRVAEILGEINDKIDNNNAISSELESLAKTIYDYWFLQFDFPDENGNPYKSSGGKMVWNDELKREIPEGWKAVQIADILGQYPRTQTVNRDDYKKGEKYPIIDQSKDFICGYSDDSNKVLHMKDCIVYGDHTTFLKYINFDFCRGADGTQVINSKEANLSNILLYYELKELPIIEIGYKRHFKFLKSQYIIVPSKQINDLFRNASKTLFDKKKNILKENRQLTSLRDFLLPLLMNGQVTVK